MTFYIITYHHKHGTDTWPHFGKEPSEDEIVKGLREEGNWDDEDDNRIDTYIDITGPFEVPKESA